MRNSHIINVFGTRPLKKITKSQQPMIITMANGTTITIPSKAIKATGFLRESVAKRLFSEKISDIVWLNEHFGIEFEFDADKRNAKKGVVLNG